MIEVDLSESLLSVKFVDCEKEKKKEFEHFIFYYNMVYKI